MARSNQNCNGNKKATTPPLLPLFNQKPWQCTTYHDLRKQLTAPETIGLWQVTASIRIQMARFSWPPVRVRPGAQRASDLRLYLAGQSHLGPTPLSLPQFVRIFFKFHS